MYSSMEEKGEIKCSKTQLYWSITSQRFSQKQRLILKWKKHKCTFTSTIIVCLKKCLRIPKGSKAVNRRRTDNTMGWSKAVNRKRRDNTMAKGTRTNNDLQNTTPKIKDRTTLRLGMNSGAPEGLADRAPLVTPIVLPLSDRYWLVIKVRQMLRHVLSNDSIKVPQVLRHVLSNDIIVKKIDICLFEGV